MKNFTKIILIIVEIKSCRRNNYYSYSLCNQRKKSEEKIVDKLVANESKWWNQQNFLLAKFPASYTVLLLYL